MKQEFSNQIFVVLVWGFSVSAYSSEPSPPVSNPERQKYIHNLESVKNYRPQSKEEALYYGQLYQFLTQNKKAQELLSSAWQDPTRYSVILNELERKRSHVRSNLKYLGGLIRDNVNLKGRVDLGREIQGIGGGKVSFGLDQSGKFHVKGSLNRGKTKAEVNLGVNVAGIAKGLISRKSSIRDGVDNQIDYTARFFAKEQFACLQSQTTCAIHTLPHLKNALVTVDQFWDHFPRMKDSSGRVLSFQTMAQRTPEQAQLALSLFNLSQTERIGQSVSRERRKMVQQMVQFHQKQEKNREEKLKQAKSVQRVSDYQNQDPVVEQALNEIKTGQQAKADLKLELDKGAITQDYYDEAIVRIDQKILQTEKGIELYGFKTEMRTATAWVGAVVSLAKVTGAPPEVLQTGAVIYEGLNIAEQAGSMIIAGALDPTGITLIANSVGVVLSIFSNTPSTEQIILENLGILREGQAEILGQLGEVDSKVEILGEKVDFLIQATEMNHEEVMGGLGNIQDQIIRMEEEILTALAKSERTTLTESQNIQGLFILDGAVAVEAYPISKPRHLNKQLAMCQQYKERDEETQNVRRYLDYGMCMEEAKEEFNDIEDTLSNLYLKSSRLFNSKTFVQEQTLPEKNELKTDKVFDAHVDNRVGLLSSVVEWLSAQYKDYIHEAPFLNTPWLDNHEAWLNYGFLLQSLPADSGQLYHPEFYDRAFSIYTKNSARLPDIDSFNFLLSEVGGEPVPDYISEPLSAMCKNVQNVEQISELSRQNLNKAYATYLYFLAKLHFEIHGAFSSLQSRLMKSYSDYNLLRKPPNFDSATIGDCHCDKTYTDKQTNVFQYVAGQAYSPAHFLISDPGSMARQASSALSTGQLKNQGFWTVDPYETDCELKNGEPITKGWVESDHQVQLLKDTLESVQSGAQGGCWFTDKYGLVSGVKGQKIQLYQKDNIDPETGRDYGFETIFKPMCAVFVTDTSGRYFLWNEWDEPVERGICIEANLEFIYDSYSIGFFDKNNFQHRLYYSDEASIQKGQRPKRISAKKYIERLWDMTKHKLTAKERYSVVRNLDQVEYDSYGHISYYQHTAYHNALKKLYNRYFLTDEWDTSFSMKIDNIDNQKHIGAQQWVDNMERNRDSVGTCNRYACIKPKPKILPDRAGWIRRATEQIKTAQTELTESIQTFFHSDQFLHLQQSPENKELPYSGLIRAILAFDTIARAGYGHDLEGQPQLSAILQTALNLKTNLLNQKSNPTALIQAVNEVYSKHIIHNEWADVLSLPLEPVVKDLAVGLGRPELRHEALNIISSRSYLSPPECHYLNRGLLP